MLVEQKLEKAIQSCQRALKEYRDGDKHLSLGSIDYIEEYVTAAKWILISEIKEDEEREAN